MTIDEHIEQAKEWGKCIPEGSIGWRRTCMELALEVERLRNEVERIRSERTYNRIAMLKIIYPDGINPFSIDDDDEQPINTTSQPVTQKCCEGGPQWGHSWDCEKVRFT